MVTLTTPQPSTAGAWRPAPRAGVEAYPLDDELVLCDTATGQVFLLNATGARVWAACDGRRTIDALARSISGVFGVDEDRARADVAELVADLESAGLLIRR